MLSRVVAAAFAAACALFAASAPVQSAARGGGMGIGGHGFSGGGFRGIPHRVGPVFGHRGLRHQPHVIPHGLRNHVVRAHFARHAFFHHRHFTRDGVPVGWGAGGAYYYDPSAYNGQYTGTVTQDPNGVLIDPTPVADSRAPIGYVRTGCRSQDVKVPGERGGEHIVTVTRC
jgi:hypothetical protein